MAAPAVDREKRELREKKQGAHDQRLLEIRLGTNLVVLAHGDVSDQRQSEGMLAEHRTLEGVERDTCRESEREPPGARRRDGPIKHHEREKRRAKHIERWR